jgi:Putative Ig domain/FG-GAP-like repeat
MQITDKSNFLKTLLILVILPLFLYAGEWHTVSEQPGAGTVNALTSRDFNQFFGVGDNGRFYRGYDSGRNWEYLDTPTNVPLNDITLFFGSFSDVLIAVGKNGQILRSEDLGNSWVLIDTVTNINLNTVEFDLNSNLVWVGGDNGELYNSNDYGVTWVRVVLENDNLDIQDMVSDYDGLFLAGIKNDTSFVHTIQSFQPYVQFAAGDTIPDVLVKDLTYSQSVLYITGNEVGTNNARLFSRFSSLGMLDLLTDDFTGPSVNITGMDIFNFFGADQKQKAAAPIDIMWITTDIGEIWESRDLGKTWQTVYVDPQSRPLNTVLTGSGFQLELGQALVGGVDDLFIKYSFELLFVIPYINDQINYPLPQLDLQFSAIPDQASLLSEIAIKSNFSGDISFIPEFDLFDSTRVSLKITRPFSTESVPGENWNISFGSGLRQKRDDGLPAVFADFNYGVSFAPYGNGSLNFAPAIEQPQLNTLSTNFVTGWFNEDDIFDLMTYANNQLYLYEVDPDGNMQAVDSFSVGQSITVEATLKDQLLLADLNNDGFQDVLLYDSNKMISVLNFSSGTTFSFSPSGAAYNSFGIKQVLVFNFDNNSLPDVLVLNDSLAIHQDINDLSFGSNFYYIETFTDLQRIAVGDVDSNGLPDILGTTSSGALSYYQGVTGGFGFPSTYANSASYRDVFIADLNQDKKQDIIVLKDDNLDLYSVNQNNQTQLVKAAISPILQNKPTYIEDVLLHDFGGEVGDFNNPAQYDLVLLTQDSSVKIFENDQFQTGGFSFAEREDKQIKLPYAANGLIQWDANRDANLDILTFSRDNGHFLNIINKSWTPYITELFTEPEGVRIKWVQFPTNFGNFDYYRLYRDSSGGPADTFATQAGVQIFETFNQSDTTFLDKTTEQFQHYNYWVEAGFNSGESSGPSPFQSIDLVKFISGDFFGVISDTINGFAVLDSIVVPATNNLVLEPGVQFVFDDKAEFNVHGGLQVNGTESQTVEFHVERFGFDSVETQKIWRGLRLYPSIDTVRFNWFSFDGADTAIAAKDRPLRMDFGRIGQNKTGIAFFGDSLYLSNVVMDSNQVGLDLSGASRAFIKNVNFLSNQQVGLKAASPAKVNIKNAIIWNNLVNDVAIQGGAQVNLFYSSINQIFGNFTGLELNRTNLPVFLPPDSGFYRPDPLSPTVDAGDPNDDFSLEPLPNGGRINQGLFGGSMFATKSFRAKAVSVLDTLFASAKIGESDTLVFDIRNTGAADLNISAMSIKNNPDRFIFIGSTVAQILPGQAGAFSLVFSPLLRQEYGDTLFVTSNDPANPFLAIPLFGHGLNSLPSVTNSPDTTALTGREYSFVVNTQDDDNDDVTISFNTKPAWLNLGNGNELRGTPTPADAGKNPVGLKITDSFGGSVDFDFSINVVVDNIAPVFTSIPDTTIYTNVPFIFTWKVNDSDGDTLTYSDNSPLFVINPDSGQINFTPLIADTGRYEIILQASDGKQTISDTFAMVIKLNFMNAPVNLILSPLDKAITVNFNVAENDLYSGTLVRYAFEGPVLSPTDGILRIDSIFTANKDERILIDGLGINQTFYISVFNYFKADGIIYSEALSDTTATLAPLVEIDQGPRRITLPVDQISSQNIQVNNLGGGTLIARFAYQPDSLSDVWFDMDTTEQVIAPFDTGYVNFEVHPNKFLRGTSVDKNPVQVTLISNDPTDNTFTFNIILDPVFDDFAPQIVVTARSDSLVRESSFAVHFYADDTTGNPIGEPENSLYKHYRLFKGLLNPELISEADSLKTNELLFSRLDNGAYVLRLWAYDTEKNGLNGAKIKNIPFIIDANKRFVRRNRWHMVSIPRPIETIWQEFVVDSTVQIYRWDNTEDRYVPIHTVINTAQAMGQAVWLISGKGFSVDVEKLGQAEFDDSLSASIVKGWNQVGTPIGYTTAWADMSFIPEGGTKLSLVEAADQGLITDAVYWYEFVNDDVQGYQWREITEANAVPWRGYWLESDTTGILVFTTTAKDTLKKDSAVLPKQGLDLSFNISLKNSKYVDARNIFGIADGPVLKRDISEPPHIGPYCALYFTEKGQRFTRQLKPNFVSDDVALEWDVTVESREAQLVHGLNWDQQKIASSGLYIFLVDEKKEEIIDMAKEDNYTFKPGSDFYRFKIYASQDATFRPKLIPFTFKLAQNFPNPFNPSTKIRFGIPNSAAGDAVRLRIFNVLGQQVIELFNKSFEPGYHEVEWNGTNIFGENVASGVYFYNLTMGKGKRLVKKMILLR